MEAMVPSTELKVPSTEEKVPATELKVPSTEGKPPAAALKKQFCRCSNIITFERTIKTQKPWQAALSQKRTQN